MTNINEYKSLHISDLMAKELHLKHELDKFFISGKTKHIFDVLIRDYKSVIREIASRENYDSAPVVHYKDGIRLADLAY